jgi:hypothetical protein
MVSLLRSTILSPAKDGSIQTIFEDRPVNANLTSHSDSNLLHCEVSPDSTSVLFVKHHTAHILSLNSDLSTEFEIPDDCLTISWHPSPWHLFLTFSTRIELFDLKTLIAVQTIEINDGISICCPGPRNSFWQKFAVMAVVGDFFPYVVFPFLPMSLSITTAEYANIRADSPGCECFFNPTPGGFEFRGAFGLQIPPALVELEMAEDRDDVPILDIAWGGPTRVILLRKGSIEIMDMQGCFPTFFGGNERPGIGLIAIRRIESEDIVKFMTSGKFLFGVSETDLFQISEDGEVEGIDRVVESLAITVSGEILVARDGEISRCGSAKVDIRALADALRNRVAELRQRRGRLEEKQSELERRVDRLEKVPRKFECEEDVGFE